ncbi:MAG TPA: cysteine desulfurase, partial [Gammaproteobacteria bacterium]|nr:cysteine desulfurase [Gammaproteobacteria bacterium]
MAVYLDNNATTALDEAVLDVMLPYMREVTGNPSSVHRFGRLQKDAIEQARESVARLLGARAEQVIFTSGGTESNNLLLNGFSQRLMQLDQGGRIALSAIEHMSLLEPASHLSLPVDSIAVDGEGRVELSAIQQVVQDQTKLISVMAANNETGVIQDLAPIIKFAGERGCFVHSDASQAAGKIPLNFIESGLDAMTVSAHKLYGPIGAGALIIDKKLPITKLQFGGSQEKNLRAGTENVPAIVGFGKAAELACETLQQTCLHTRSLRDALEKGLKKLSVVSIFSETVDRLPNTVQFGVSGFDGETLLMQLDRKAIAVSSGSACTS